MTICGRIQLRALALMGRWQSIVSMVSACRATASKQCLSQKGLWWKFAADATETTEAGRDAGKSILLGAITQRRDQKKPGMLPWGVSKVMSR